MRLHVLILSPIRFAVQADYTGLAGAGNCWHNSCTCPRTRVCTAVSSGSASTSPIHAAICRISVSRMPCDVNAGVPMWIINPGALHRAWLKTFVVLDLGSCELKSVMGEGTDQLPADVLAGVAMCLPERTASTNCRKADSRRRKDRRLRWRMAFSSTARVKGS